MNRGWISVMFARVARDKRLEGKPPLADDEQWAKRQEPARIKRRRQWLWRRHDARVRLGLCTTCAAARPCRHMDGIQATGHRCEQNGTECT